MKVLVLTNMFPTPENPAYGIFVKEQVESLRRAGIEIDVFFIKGYQRKWNYLKAMMSLWQRLFASRTMPSAKYDLIHAHYGLSGWVGRMQWSLPLVVTFHGDDLLGTPATSPKSEVLSPKYTLSSRLLVGLNKVLARLSDAVIVQSDQMRKRLGLSLARVIPCGVDFTVFKPSERRQACVQSGLNPEKRYILFPSNPVISVKNFALARTVFDIIRNKVAVPPRRDAEASRSRFSGIEIITLENLPREKVVCYMNACDVMLVTSLHEAGPLVVKEAMACNLPIVSVEVGDVKEVIKGTKNCFITSRNPQEMAERIIQILNSGERSNGRENIGHLEINEIAKRIIEVYRLVVSC